ncbi:MAG: hypothetical protein RJA09_1933 [Pseudomonadota bacterium]|jgi:hypothetical protein
MDVTSTPLLLLAFVAGAACAGAVCWWRQRPAPGQAQVPDEPPRPFGHTLPTDGTAAVLSQPIALAWVERLVSLAARTGQPVSVVALALDTVPPGAPPLAQVLGPALVSRLRTHDVVGAWGDNRLVLVLPDTDIGGAVVVAEDVRQSGVAGPMSLGLHSLWPDVSDPPRERAHALVAGALAALSSAQVEGGDRTAVEPPS